MVESGYQDVVASWIPVAEACKLLKVSRQRIYQLLAAGKISGVKREQTWLINVRSVQGRRSLLLAERGIDHARRA